MHKAMNDSVVYTTERFPGLLKKTLPAEVYERIWVCGPPAMNDSMV